MGKTNGEKEAGGEIILPLNTRHWAIVGIVAVTIGALFTETDLEKLSIVFGVLGTALTVDYALARVGKTK